MKGKNIIQSVAVLLLFLCLTGSAATDKGADVAGKTYEYTGESFSSFDGDAFRITIHADGTFSYCESVLSSYLGFGEWSVRGDVLTLTDNEEVCIYRKNYFRIDGDDLVFMEDDSTNFIYINVKDGERFTKTEPQEVLELT